MMLGLMQTYLNMEVDKTRNQIQDLDTTQVAHSSQPLRGTDANSWQNASPWRRAASGSEVKWRDESAKLNEDRRSETSCKHNYKYSSETTCSETACTTR